MCLFYRTPHADEVVVEFDSPFLPVVKSSGWVSEGQDAFLKSNRKRFSEVLSYGVVFASFFNCVTSILNFNMCPSIDVLFLGFRGPVFCGFFAIFVTVEAITKP